MQYAVLLAGNLQHYVRKNSLFFQLWKSCGNSSHGVWCYLQHCASLGVKLALPKTLNCRMFILWRNRKFWMCLPSVTWNICRRVRRWKVEYIQWHWVFSRQSHANSSFSCLQMFNEPVSAISDKITQCTLELYKMVARDLPPTPSKFHYIFNLRDLSRVYNGLILTSPER